jgi:hypothetical protein
VVRVVYVRRPDAIRLIPAWKASPHDGHVYAETRSRAGRDRPVEGFADTPEAEPLSPAFKALDEAEIERRAAADSDAGPIPPRF